jgi:hypothetical protein
MVILLIFHHTKFVEAKPYLNYQGVLMCNKNMKLSMQLCSMFNSPYKIIHQFSALIINDMTY